MTGADKVICQAAALLLLFTLSTVPAKAQLAGFGGGAGGGDMMTQFAPMLEMMKAKMGKRRFGQMMQTMGPMMSKMMDGGGGGSAVSAALAVVLVVVLAAASPVASAAALRSRREASAAAIYPACSAAPAAAS